MIRTRSIVDHGRGREAVGAGGTRPDAAAGLAASVENRDAIGLIGREGLPARGVPLFRTEGRDPHVRGDDPRHDDTARLGHTRGFRTAAGSRLRCRPARPNPPSGEVAPIPSGRRTYQT